MIPVIHYSFYCHFKLKIIYISVLFVLSIASVVGTSTAACSKPQFRPFKAILFIALGLYGMKILNFFYIQFFKFF
jgi:adiponectin receptor